MAKEVEKPASDTAWLTETPEFREAVAKAAASAAEQAKAEILAVLKSGTHGAPSDTTDLMRGLALAIAEMSHQGDQRDKPVDPKVLAERRAGMERLFVKILEAKALPKGDPRTPKYRCSAKSVLNETMIMPYRRDPVLKLQVPVEFRWRGEPNDAMVPLNEMAKEIFAEFRASRGSKTDYQKEAFKPVWATDGGLIIEGAGPARREIVEARKEEDEDGLEIAVDPYDPNAEFVHVLGTAHEPARQNYQGKAP